MILLAAVTSGMSVLESQLEFLGEVKSQGRRPVKIVFVIGSLAAGGAERQLIHLLRGLDRSRWEPSLVLFEQETARCAAGLVDNVFSLDIPSSGNSHWPSRAIKVLRATAKLASYLRRTRPHIVHAILPSACILAAFARRLAHVPSVVGSRRSLTDSYRTGAFVGFVDRFATRMCDSMIGNCSAVTAELITCDGVRADRATTIYNGVDTNLFTPGDRTMRRTYGWTDEHVVFGLVANFIPYKCHIDFIRAAAIIASQAAQARFIMAGEDRGILSDLKAEISRAGLQSRFTIIPGLPHPEELFPALDVYVCTSRTEGFSNVLLEASACELPLVVTRVGGNPEIVADRANGFLVAARAPDEIAAAALTLLRNPDLRRSMGQMGRRIVETNFSIEAMVRNYDRFYEACLLGGPTAGAVQFEADLTPAP